jgi:hypothetical protein
MDAAWRLHTHGRGSAAKHGTSVFRTGFSPDAFTLETPWAMTWTSMLNAPASLMIRTTLDPPPVSCCHRLRRLAPITTWVI